MRDLMMDQVLACIHLTDEVDWIKRERSNGYATANTTRLPSQCSWTLDNLPQPFIPIFTHTLPNVLTIYSG